MSPHLESSFETVTEIMTLVPRDAEACAPGVTSPIHEIEARGVLNHCSVDGTRMGYSRERGERERMAVTFSRASLPWDLKCGDEIRRSGDEKVYEILEVVPEGVSLVTALVLPIRARGFPRSG
jgi:hypothetical protein